MQKTAAVARSTALDREEPAGRGPLGPTGWEQAAALLWLLLALPACSNVVVPFLPMLFLAVGGGVLLLFWVVRAIVYLVERRLGPRGAMLPARRPLGWAICPLALAIWAGAVSFDLPFRYRLRSSEAELLAYVRSIGQGPQRGVLPGPGRVGWFRIAEVDRVEGCVRLVTTGYLNEDAGLVYAPDQRPPRVGGDRYQRIAGPWWRWRRSW